MKYRERMQMATFQGQDNDQLLFVFYKIEHTVVWSLAGVKIPNLRLAKDNEEVEAIELRDRSSIPASL